ncbi:MAG: MFS transporter [Acidobacteriota bacterium]|nr:MFS transporter [Acidobacteriota bacterium]
MTLDEQEMPAENENRFVRLFLYLSFILVGIVNTFLGPTLPFLYDKWHLNDVQAGYLLAAQSLGGLLGALTASFLFAKLSARRIFFVGYVFIVVSLLGLNGGVWQIGLFSSFLSGIALGLIIPTTTLIVSQTAGENRAAAINILNFFWALGAVSSPLLFFALSSPSQLNYLFIAIAFVAACFSAFSFKLKNIRIASSEEKTAASGREKLTVLFSAWLFVVTVFLQIGVEASLGGWLPTFAKRITSSDWWMLVPTFYWTGFLLSRLLSAFYLRLIGEKPAILFGLLLALVGQLFFLLTIEINIAAAGAFLVGFGTAPIFPTTIAVLSGKFEKKAPELLSYMFLLAGLSGMTFSWLIGYAASLTGELKFALFIPLICSLILFALHLSLLKKRRA